MFVNRKSADKLVLKDVKHLLQGADHYQFLKLLTGMQYAKVP